MNNKTVSNTYLKYREQVLKYTYHDMNLSLDNDQQVYIAVFDIPAASNIVGGNTQTIAMVFGLNTHIYYGTGDVITGLEKHKDVMKAMQSLLISAHQVLSKMQLVDTYEYYESKNIRVYLKTQKGVYFKELKGECKEDKFVLMLLNNVRSEIAKCI